MRNGTCFRKKEFSRLEAPRILVPKPDGCELHSSPELFWVVDSSSVNEYGLLHVLDEIRWFELLEFVPFRYEYTTIRIPEALNC